MNKSIELPPILIKVGNEKDLIKLQKHGQIYFGSFSNYRKQEKEEFSLMLQSLITNKPINTDDIDCYRRDELEGLEYRIKGKMTIKFPHDKLKHIKLEDPDGKINIYQNQYEHLYCLYAIPSLLDSDFQIDERMLKFGNHALIIHNPKIFLERIIEKLSGKFDLNFVKYYCEEKDNYTAFEKRDLFRYQSEFRITANLSKNNSLYIGNIEDISTLIDSRKLLDIEYEIQ